MSVDAPGRNVWPLLHGVSCPGRGFVCMAARAGIWNLVLIGHLGSNEIERVAADVDVRDCLLNLRHVAGHAVASSAAVLMMSVRFDRRRVWSVRRRRSMTVQTKLSRRLNQIRIVYRPMNIMT